MKKKFRLYVGFLLMASGVCAMTACSGGEESIANTTGGGSVSKTDEVLTLTINTGNVSSRVTDITTDPGVNAENTINRITVGIFDASGNVRTIQELTSGNGTTGDGTFKVTTSGSNAVAEANLVTTSLTAGDKILAAVNAPAGHFSGVTSQSAFAKDLLLGVALTTSGSSATPTSAETSNNVPMYGESTLSGSAGNFSANVPVKHLIAKVSLESLSVDFDENGSYSQATFTPTAFFLINVPEKLVFQDTPVWTISNTNWHHGSPTDKTAAQHGTYEEYLTTTNPIAAQELKGKNGSGTETFSGKYFLYAMPNNSDADGTRTKLVIAGKFKADGQTPSNNGNDVYYPVSLNATYDPITGAPSAPDGTVYKVYPNKNYKCSVTIKTMGSDDPWKSIDPEAAKITVTVQDFEDVSQSTTFK